MKANKFYNKLSLIGLVCALTLLSGCNKATPALQEQTTSSSTIQTNQNIASPQVTSQGQSEIHFIDTGNSDAILIINNGEAMLIDGADNDDEEFLVRYLKDYGITELEYLIATHAHADHVGGLDAVVSNLHVNTVFVANGDADTKTYRDFINAVMDKGLTPSVPLEDSQFPLGNAYFKVMNTNGGGDTNNQSLVVEYINGEDKALFMGDAEEEVEKEILSKVEQVDLLKVGHHGSRTSTSQEFLDKVNPTYAVITCGEGNSYGHPHQETLDKLEGVEVHRTDKCSTIIFKSTGHGITTDCENGTLGSKNNSTNNASASVDTQTSNSSTSIESNNSSAANSSNQTDSSSTSAVSHQVTSSSEDRETADSATSPTTTTTANTTTKDTGTVYWTPNGKSYHKTDECSTLSRSKTILSGTISESGKTDPCDKCYY